MTSLEYKKIFNIYVECYSVGYFEKIKDRIYRKRYKKKPYYHEEIYLRKFCNRLYLNNYFYDDIKMLSSMFRKMYSDKEYKKKSFLESASKYILLFCTGLGTVFFWSFFSDSTPYAERPIFLSLITNVFVLAIFTILLRYAVIETQENYVEIFLYRLQDVAIMMAKDEEINQLNITRADCSCRRADRRRNQKEG